MTTPFATYRLQLRNGMTFARAAELAGYLARLGVSHLYISPPFAAAAGSTHGYDGIDFGVLEPGLGGEQGWAVLQAALRQAGIGLLVDFVPNHMAASEANLWWRSVLEWGPESPCAPIFDVDWSAPRLILPILGGPYGEALRDGAFGLAFDAASGSFAFTCYDRRLPLVPRSYGLLLARARKGPLADLARRFPAATVDEGEALKWELAHLAAQPGHAATLRDMLDRAADDPGLLHEIHEAQIWRLAHWRLAREALTYRRFFEIADLVCLRVEDPAVFDRVHAGLFGLVAAGGIAGVRLDHVDGLADPRAYLERLQQAMPGAGPAWLLVEKILEGEEELPADWPVAGTTGYEFIASLAGLFVDRRREAEMSRAYRGFAGEQVDYAPAVLAAKREILTHNLASELGILTARAVRLAGIDARTRDYGADSLRRAVIELACAFPVYRTYVGADGARAADRAVVAAALESARASRALEDDATLEFVARLLLLDVPPEADRDLALAFATRFQQTTGALMAKAAEDTVFYRYNRLIALNEVGGAPDVYGAPASRFHATMAERCRSRPAGLSATSTHDTKRGEDARARLYVLSEMPETWERAVARWSRLNAPHRRDVAGKPMPEPNLEWLFYQALVGAWPADLGIGNRTGPEPLDGRLASLRDRMLSFMEKAMREAKTHTSWTRPDAACEAAVADFVARSLSPDGGGEFLRDFVETCRPVWLAGAVNGLAQLALKMTAPGVPDLYQGTELWDLSLVDPDNRTPVDYARRAQILDAAVAAQSRALLADWMSGAPKAALTAAGLRLRAENPALFATGGYTGLRASGERSRHVVAFARTIAGASVVTVVPRFVLLPMEGADMPLVPSASWGDTQLPLPAALCGAPLRDALTGAVHDTRKPLRVADLLARFPVALLCGGD
ncbi:MAG: malto-oligosyltrehalose synthase [Rhodospirillaceae bacterium]